MNKHKKKSHNILCQSIKLKTNNHKQSKASKIIKNSSMRKSIKSNSKNSKQSYKLQKPYNINELIAPYFDRVALQTHNKRVSLSKRNKSSQSKIPQLSSTVPVKYSKSRLLQFPFDSIKFKPTGKSTNFHQIQEIKEFSHTYNDGFYIQYDQPEQTIQNQHQSKHQLSKPINSFNQRISKYTQKQLTNKILAKDQTKQNNISTSNNIQFKDKQFKQSLIKLFRFIDQQRKGSISYYQISKVKIPEPAFYFLGTVFQKIKQKQLILSQQSFIRECLAVYKRSSIDDIQWFMKAMTQIKICQNLPYNQPQYQQVDFVRQKRLNYKAQFEQYKQSQSDPKKLLISFRQDSEKNNSCIQKEFIPSQKKDPDLKGDSFYYSNQPNRQQIQERLFNKNKTGQIKKNMSNKPDDLRDKIYAKLQAMKSTNPRIDKQNNFSSKKQVQKIDNYYSSNPLSQQKSTKINIIQNKFLQQNVGSKWQSSTNQIDKSYNQLQKLKSEFNNHKQIILQKQKQRQNCFKIQLNQIQTKISQENQKIQKCQQDDQESRIVRVFGNNQKTAEEKLKASSTSSNFYQKNIDRLGALNSYKRSLHIPTTYVPKSDNFSLRQIEMSLPIQHKQQKLSIDRRISNEQVSHNKLDKIDLLSQKIEDYLRKNANKIQVSKNFTSTNIGKFNKI